MEIIAYASGLQPFENHGLGSWEKNFPWTSRVVHAHFGPVWSELRMHSSVAGPRVPSSLHDWGLQSSGLQSQRSPATEAPQTNSGPWMGG